MVFTKQMLLTDWHVMRVIRLIFSGAVAWMAWQDGNALLGFLSALLLLQVITNTGCGARGCSVPRSNLRSRDPDDVEFSEIKIKSTPE